MENGENLALDPPVGLEKKLGPSQWIRLKISDPPRGYQKKSWTPLVKPPKKGSCWIMLKQFWKE